MKMIVYITAFIFLLIAAIIFIQILSDWGANAATITIGGLDQGEGVCSGPSGCDSYTTEGECDGDANEYGPCTWTPIPMSQAVTIGGGQIITVGD